MKFRIGTRVDISRSIIDWYASKEGMSAYHPNDPEYLKDLLFFDRYLTGVPAIVKRGDHIHTEEENYVISVNNRHIRISVGDLSVYKVNRPKDL